MGVLKKVIIVSSLVLLTALVWQWTRSVDIQEFYKEKRVILTGASRGIGRSLGSSGKNGTAKILNHRRYPEPNPVTIARENLGCRLCHLTRSLAIQLAQLGAKVVIAARTADKLAETKQECEQYTSDIHTVIADVAKEEDCREIVNKTVNEFGGVDILILNAAYSPVPQFFTDSKQPHGKKFADVFSVNVLQSVHLVHFALPHLNTSRGIIVPVSSAAGLTAIPKTAAYGTSKHALHGFFKALNQEFILTNTPVSITIMPLPYVLTKKAVDNWKPIGTGDGITPEDCAERMLRGIPLRQLWYYVDWMAYTIGHLYSLAPEFFDWFVRIYLPHISNLF